MEDPGKYKPYRFPDAYGGILGLEKEKILETVKNEIEKSKDILIARIYGSWLNFKRSIDLDICTIIPSK